MGSTSASDSFADTNENGKFDFLIWVKNVGSTTIDAVEESDVFLGQTGSFVYIPHESDVESTVYPRWSFSLENNSTEWAPRATVKVTVTYDSPPDAVPATGTYDVKVIVPIGVSDETFFSI